MKTYSKRTVLNGERNAHNDELQDRLNHYNDWLMDNNRDFASTYPGYPGDKANKPTTAKVEKPKVAPVKPPKKGKSVMKIETVGVKVARSAITKAPKAGSKQAKANEIVMRIGVANKIQAIEAIMAEASMSKAGATTYYHNARHFLAAQDQVTA
jgi:hypothetical protein